MLAIIKVALCRTVLVIIKVCRAVLAIIKLVRKFSGNFDPQSGRNLWLRVQTMCDVRGSLHRRRLVGPITAKKWAGSVRIYGLSW